MNAVAWGWWNDWSDDAVEIGCHLEVSAQCFSSQRRPKRQIKLETDERERLSDDDGGEIGR